LSDKLNKGLVNAYLNGFFFVSTGGVDFELDTGVGVGVDLVASWGTVGFVAGFVADFVGLSLSVEINLLTRLSVSF